MYRSGYLLRNWFSLISANVRKWRAESEGRSFSSSNRLRRGNGNFSGELRIRHAQERLRYRYSQIHMKIQPQKQIRIHTHKRAKHPGTHTFKPTRRSKVNKHGRKCLMLIIRYKCKCQHTHTLWHTKRLWDHRSFQLVGDWKPHTYHLAQDVRTFWPGVNHSSHVIGFNNSAARFLGNQKGLSDHSGIAKWFPRIWQQSKHNWCENKPS